MPRQATHHHRYHRLGQTLVTAAFTRSVFCNTLRPRKSVASAMQSFAVQRDWRGYRHAALLSRTGVGTDMRTAVERDWRGYRHAALLSGTGVGTDMRRC